MNKRQNAAVRTAGDGCTWMFLKWEKTKSHTEKKKGKCKYINTLCFLSQGDIFGGTMDSFACSRGLC